MVGPAISVRRIITPRYRSTMDPVSTSGINGTAVGVVDKYIVTNRGQSSRRGEWMGLKICEHGKRADTRRNLKA